MEARELLGAVFAAGVAAVEPAAAVRRAVRVVDGVLVAGDLRFPLQGPGRIVVIGFGKAAVPMAWGLVSRLPPGRAEGILAAPEARAAPFPVIAAGHPLPDEGSVRAGREALRLAAAARAEDLVVVLVSGGGSALLEVPVAGVTLEDLAATTEALSRAGADITALNTVRKHLSEVKGGRLGRAARRARMLTLVVSDVVGDPLEVIASGPTVPDATTPGDALRVLERHGLRERVPGAVLAALEAAARRRDGESGAGHPRQVVRVVANGARAAEAAVAAARRRGMAAEVVTTRLVGEARVRGVAAVRTRRPGDPLLVFAGETTVTVHGRGRGGRNQEAALAAAAEIAESDVVFLAAGTDGIDGPTEAAGAVVDGTTIRRGRALGLDADDHLSRNDAHAFLAATGDLLVTGPTGTNVGDLWLVLREGRLLSVRSGRGDATSAPRRGGTTESPGGTNGSGGRSRRRGSSPPFPR